MNMIGKLSGAFTANCVAISHAAVVMLAGAVVKVTFRISDGELPATAAAVIAVWSVHVGRTLARRRTAPIGSNWL